MTGGLAARYSGTLWAAKSAKSVLVPHELNVYECAFIISQISTVAMIKPYYVHALWDDEVNVWVASSDDVPGLATEAATAEALIEKLKVIIPELLQLNGQSPTHPIPFELLTRRFAVAA